MKFAAPLYLFLLMCLPLIAWLALALQRRASAKLARLAHTTTAPGHRFYWQLAFLLGAMAALIVALSRPQWGTREETLQLHSRNVMIAVDVSRSMLAADVHPNRLGRAKADLIDLVDALGGDRAGIIAFRKTAVLLCPMTTDRAYLRQTIDALSPASAPKGETDLADPIQKSFDAFERAQSSHNAIVLISDGEDLAGRATELAKLAGKRGIPIFTVGIGSASGATITDDKGLVTFEGKAVQTKLTESTLKAIATASGGQYIPLATASTAQTTLGALYARYLTHLAAADEEARMETAFAERDTLFAAIAVVLLLLAGALSLGRVGRMTRAAAVALLLVNVARGEPLDPARNAQSLYRAGDYVASAEAYQAARAGAEPSQVALYAYNEALAEWKAGAPTNALEALKLAVTAPDFVARASTLEGALQLELAGTCEDLAQRLTHREAAVAAFTKALQADPSDRARRNLTRAREGLVQLRQDVRRSAALERDKDAQLGQLFSTLLQRQRVLDKSAVETFSGPSASVRISQADALAAQLREQADHWYKVIADLPQAVTNETERAELLTHAAQAQQLTNAAADQFETLDASMKTLSQVEPIAYNFWKAVADPPALNGESLALMQQQVEKGTPLIAPRQNLPETEALMQQFRLLFPNWAEEQLKQQAQAAQQPPKEGEKAAEPTFTEADRDLIARTADATIPLFKQPPSAQTSQQILDNLKLIQEHLPKQQNQNQQNQDQQQQQKQDQQKQDQQQNQDQQDQKPQEPKKQDQEQPQERAEDRKKRDLKARLQKAADREREHEAEKARRAELLSSSPDERDW